MALSRQDSIALADWERRYLDPEYDMALSRYRPDEDEPDEEKQYILEDIAYEEEAENRVLEGA